MTPTNADLRQFILQAFSDEELETLVFDYFPEVIADFGRGMSQNRKAILLIGHCGRRGRMDDLRAALARERLQAWQQVFAGVTPDEKSSFSEKTRFLNERDPRQVFISHATADAAFAHLLAGDLRAEGWRVWIAPESIRAGEKWVEAIDRGLEESGSFLVVLTPAAVASRWVRTETSAAIGMEHRDLIRFLPLDVAECQPPALWTQYQYLPFRESYEVGLDELLRWLEQDPLPNPPPKGEGVRSPSPREGLGEGRSPAQEKRVKEEQWRQLQALAHEIAAELGRQSGQDELRAVYRRFNRQFGLTTYKKLPRRRFAEALAFLTDWQDEIARSAQRGPGPGPSVETSRRDVSTPLITSTPPPKGGVGQKPFRLEHIVSRTGDPSLSNLAVHEKTGIQFIRIPAGPFLYGDNNEPVDLPEYWIGRAPVTNAQYKRFLDANPQHPVPFVDTEWAKPHNWHRESRSYPADKADHPVVLVSWNDVQAFCDWAGLQLPTEQEWEKAARGTDGRAFPWGDDWVEGRCNTGEADIDDTTPVGKYSPAGDSPYGCVDMAGNVWEWTASWSDSSQARRVVRGGSWDLIRYGARAAYRYHHPPDNRGFNLGFRVVRRPPSLAL
jgi:formylglycine-generating enzyme required for sulfatase activity